MRRSSLQDLPTSNRESSVKPDLQTAIFEDRKMDDSKTQQTDSVFTDNHATTSEGGVPGAVTLPPPERGSDNDENRDEDSFQTFVLGYN
jgi:hypothetical protein